MCYLRPNSLHVQWVNLRALLLVLRFVILQLAIMLWKVVPIAIGHLTKPIPAVLYFVFCADFVEKFDQMSPTTLAVLAVPTLVAVMLDLVYWVIVFDFGWPLLKDSSAFWGSPCRDYLMCLCLAEEGTRTQEKVLLHNKPLNSDAASPLTAQTSALGRLCWWFSGERPICRASRSRP
jgi:hypothetical protein